MTTLTKDQIRNLPPRQQEALAEAEVGRVNSRQQLLERASRGMSAWAGLLMGLTGGLAILSVVIPRILPIAIAAVVSLVGYLTSRIYRRLDAMMELFAQDSRRGADKENGDDRAGTDCGR